MHNTSIGNLFLIEQNSYQDSRGHFLKFFNQKEFKEANLVTEFKEVFVSVSKLYTIRGMHFQLPPYNEVKIVTVLKGVILDVVLDLRKDSPTYHKFEKFNLSGDAPFSLYVGKGLAHGFLSLDENSMICYLTSELYNEECNSGIQWNSFGFDWNVKVPIISQRDRALPCLNEFESPFSLEYSYGES